MRRLTSAEVAAMTKGNDAEALRARKAKLKALKISKQKRALEVFKRRIRACIERAPRASFSISLYLVLSIFMLCRARAFPPARFLIALSVAIRFRLLPRAPGGAAAAARRG